MSPDMPELPEGTPPFLRAVLANKVAAQQQMAMHREDFANRWFELLTSSGVEALLTLREVLAIEPESAQLNYLDGMIASVLRLKHGVCMDCGHDHSSLQPHEDGGISTLLSDSIEVQFSSEPRDPQDDSSD